jgi:hypothetical protein
LLLSTGVCSSTKQTQNKAYYFRVAAELSHSNKFGGIATTKAAATGGKPIDIAGFAR